MSQTHTPKPILINVQITSAYYNCHLYEIELPEHCHLLALIHQNNVILTDCDAIVNEGDWLVAIALDPAMAPALTAALEKRRAISWHIHGHHLEPHPIQDEKTSAQD